MNSPVQISKLFAGRPVRTLGEGLSVGGFSSIGIKGQRWSLRHQGESYPFLRDDDNSPLTYLDVVILEDNPHTSKLYFGDGAFTEESAAGPICASVKGDVPDPGVSMPQNKVCATCRHNQFGSGAAGRGKACQDNRRLAVMLMPKMTLKMLGNPLLEPVFFKVPPASLKTFKAYGDQLRHQGLPHEAVITRMSFNPEKNWEIVFKLVEGLSDKAAEHVIMLLERDSATIAQILGQPSSSAPALPPPIEGKLSGSNDIEDAFEAAKKPMAVTEEISEAQPKRGRGRPAGSPNKPKQIEATAIEANGNGKSSDDDWVTTSSPEMDEEVKKKMAPDIEADSALSPETQAMLGDSMKNFLKK
jgi:hypothetical protein